MLVCHTKTLISKVDLKLCYSQILGSRLLFPRFNSTTPEFSPQEIAKAQLWLEQYRPSQIPQEHFLVTYSRSSGPGGQKVNKTSSKATISMEPHMWLNPFYCSWIPKPVLSQIKVNRIRYETKSGGLLIQSDLTRNRDTNTDECFRKLLQEIKDNTYFAKEASDEDVKKWEEIKQDRKEKRLFNKKKLSDKKKSRSKNFDI